MGPAVVREYRTISAGAAFAAMTLEFPSLGIVLHGCLAMSKDGRRWVNPPSKTKVYGTEVKTSADGKPIYEPVVSFTDREKQNNFSETALAALDTYLAGGR